MSSLALSRCGCIAAAAMTGLLDRTVALAAGLTSQCDVFEYYDVSAGQCRHCDYACFDDHENGTSSYVESRCLELCPDYIKAPRLPQYPSHPEQVVKLTLMEGGLAGFLIALFIVCIIVVVILRTEVSRVLKSFCSPAKRTNRLNSFFRDADNESDGDTSYIKLADPSDEVEFVERVSCV